MSDWQLAQVNVVMAVDDLDSPRLSDFIDSLDRINALAEGSPGFVWRLKSDEGNSLDIQITDNPRFIMNMSVWESPEALFDYVYKSDHTKVMARRREWFEKPTHAYQALWWIPAGHLPTPEEGMAKLAILDRTGPSPSAFTFKQRFPKPGALDRTPNDMKPEPYCVGWN